MRRLYAVSAFVFLATLCLCSTAPAQVHSMKLLTAQVGWAATDHNLFWTTDDGAHWKDITPHTTSKESISSVFFLDASTGWVLFVYGDKKDEAHLELASTADSGKGWSMTHLVIPHLNQRQFPLSGPSKIDFVDGTHGWMVLDVESSANFRAGILLTTADGGKSWNWTPKSPGVAGRIYFTDTKNGWLAGGPGDQKLYATHDGSKSWQEVTLKAPAPVLPSAEPNFDAPTFEDSTHGFLPVTYSATEDSGSVLALFASDDGGKTWKPYSVMAKLKQSYGGLPAPSAIVDSELIIAEETGRTEVTLTRLRSAGRSTEVSANVSLRDTVPMLVSFIDKNRGWMVLYGGHLLATSDGGATWADVTPSATAERSSLQGAPSAANDAASSATTISTVPAPPVAPPTTLHTSTHLGFHKCAAGTPTEMKAWWKSSPFYDVGIYIGESSSKGGNRTCPNANLIPSWVTQVENQGWGLIPLWVGPQAPCACAPTSGGTGCQPFGNVFSTNPTVASTQGAQEADNAMNVACPLGLCNTVVYYDMEQYNATTQCSAAVQAFVDGWVSQLHIDGFKAGVYGSPYNYTDFNVSSPPDDVWIAKTLISGTPSVTIWGLSPLCDPYSVNPCNLWSNNQRIHQFLANYSETWGSVNYSVDPDIDDAAVAGFAGSKTFNYPASAFTNVDYPGANTSDAYAINDINSNASGFINGSGQAGQIAGQYVINQPQTFGGFQDNAGSFTNFTVPGAVSTSPWGINDAGSVVGFYRNSTTGHGFLYNPTAGKLVSLDVPGATAGSTFATGANDAGQVVGYYTDSSSGGTYGFFYNSTTQQFTAPYPPITPAATSLYGINGQGQVVGFNGTPFVYANGNLTYIVPTGQLYTYAYGINNNSQAVGYYLDTSYVTHAFLYDETSGSFTFFQDPNVPPNGAEWGLGVNDAAQIVGAYGDANNQSHGFLAVPQ